MLKIFIAKVTERQDLNEAESFQAMSLMMNGEALPTQIAAFLTALRMKGETMSEIAGFARAMRAQAVTIRAYDGECVADTCGTGGDGTGTFNISTAVALVAAGGGLTVAKHGNRAVSSHSGSADVLEALGVNVRLPPEAVEMSLKEIKLAFLFAPLFHPAMKQAMVPRREIGIRTIFNLLGPLTNPAGAEIHLIGVYRHDMTQRIAEVLKNLGSRAAFVVHGEDQSDEISITGRTLVTRLENGTIENFTIAPEDVGLPRALPESVRGGSPETNARIILSILQGHSGPPRDVVLFNAAAVFTASGKASSLREGVELARESLDSRRALKKLSELVQFSQTRGER